MRADEEALLEKLTVLKAELELQGMLEDEDVTRCFYYLAQYRALKVKVGSKQIDELFGLHLYVSSGYGIDTILSGFNYYQWRVPLAATKRNPNVSLAVVAQIMYELGIKVDELRIKSPALDPIVAAHTNKRLDRLDYLMKEAKQCTQPKNHC